MLVISRQHRSGDDLFVESEDIWVIDSEVSDAKLGKSSRRSYDSLQHCSFQTKLGQEQEFEELFHSLPRNFEGLRKMALIKAADGSYFSVGEWDTVDHMARARPHMIANLDKFRHTLQEHGGGLGVTDAVSGEAIFEVSG